MRLINQPFAWSSLLLVGALACSNNDNSNKAGPAPAGEGGAGVDPMNPGASDGDSGGTSAVDPNRPYNPIISASRSNCASPCTVVFSTDKTTWEGLDEHDVWGRELAFHWDFDTDESDEYGQLYEQTYTHVPGDTAQEVGYAPMVTKTFLCEAGACVYEVGVRAQDAAGNYADAFETITVLAESAAWSADETVCVSNSLALDDDWSSFDKSCPEGAARQSQFPMGNAFDGKLILLKKGDVFLQNIGPWSGQSNFKIGAFGDADEPKPELDGTIWLGTHARLDTNAPESNWSFATDETVEELGWSENITIEGIKTAAVSFPMSSQHVGIHDIDMDREASQSGGNIDLSRGRQYCTDSADLDCANVPFSKGVYISSVNVVGSVNAETNTLALNVAAIGCDMSNYTGIVDSSFRKTGEHNLRIMGWWRLSLMRSAWLGHHYSGGKQKITTRPCFDGAVTSEDLPTAENPDPNIPDTWDDDPEGRTRADLFWGVDDEYLHVSRYQATIGNVVGDPSAPRGTDEGSRKIQTNVTEGFEPTVRDVIYAENTFHNEEGFDTPDIGAPGWYVTCRENTYSDETGACASSLTPPELQILSNPEPFAYPDAPGSP